MYGKLTTRGTGNAFAALAALLLVGAALPALAEDSAADQAIADWMGKELVIRSSSFDDHIPVGGKLTFVFDGEDQVVRVCARTVTRQNRPWRMDFAAPCGVTLNYTAGTRYCTVEDVKAGNAEVLSSCHRLRSHDVAMHPAATVKGAVELHDMIVFLVRDVGGKLGIAVLVDSPSRVTAGGIALGNCSP
jgi:hypothetical protein